MLYLQKNKIWFLSTTLAISTSMSAPAIAVEKPPDWETATYEERWASVQKNIRKFMNMTKEEIVKTLGNPEAKEQKSQNRLLKYYIGDGANLVFDFTENRVDCYTLNRPIKLFHLEEWHMTGDVRRFTCPSVDKATQERRWSILEQNIQAFVNMPYEKLLNALGQPDAVMGKNHIRVLNYDLGDHVYLRFECEDELVSRYFFLLRRPTNFFSLQPVRLHKPFRQSA